MFSLDITSETAFTPDPVLKATERIWSRFLFKAAGATATTAKRLLRPARRKKVGELSDQQRADYREQQKAFRAGKAEKPRLPKASSAPNESPRLQTKPSPLKTQLRFDVNKATGVAVIGPKRSNDGIAGDLEFGRGQIKQPRPFMGPAFDKILPELPQYLRRAAN